MCVYIYTCFHNIETMVGQEKYKRNGAALNAACQGKLSVWPVGHACHRFVSLGEGQWLSPSAGLEGMEKSWCNLVKKELSFTAETATIAIQIYAWFILVCYRKRSSQFEYRITDPLHGEYLWFSGAFEKLRKATISFVMTVRLSATTRLPLETFSRNLVFEYFSKICRENSSFVKMEQERILYMKTNIHFNHM
jgi:hypothetical protein